VNSTFSHEPWLFREANLPYVQIHGNIPSDKLENSLGEVERP